MSRWKNNFLPAMAWGAYHIGVPHWHVDPLGGLFALRGFLVFIFLLIRYQPIRRAPSYQIVIAWASTLLPTQLLWSASAATPSLIGVGFIVLGATLVGISIVDLGRSFGISPAVRPFVATGIYKYMRNPMYIGHVIGELGILITTPSVNNIIIASIGWTLYGIRIFWEQKILEIRIDPVHGKAQLLEQPLDLAASPTGP